LNKQIKPVSAFQLSDQLYTFSPYLYSLMKPLLFRYEFRRSHLEAFFWLAALIALGTFTPTEEGHSTLCLIRRFDLGFCPGCGLGHSIAWLFRGNISESFHAHPMGVPAVIILIGRIINILKPNISFNRNKYYGKDLSTNS
jgi:hypothetical protein